MRATIVLAISALVLNFAPFTQAQSIDRFEVNRHLSNDSETASLTNAAYDHAQVNTPLELEDVILQAICASAQARKAWANARAHAAAVGLRKAAYLPALSATVGGERDTLSTTYDIQGFGHADVPQTSKSKYAMLNLSWVLFDFGKRSADLREAQELLIAANAEHDEALQRVFYDAAQAYYALWNAQATVNATRQTEAIAKESVAEATAKHEAGVGSLSDQLQAQTTYRRALLDRVTAEGEERTASGVLATAMGLNADVPVQINMAATFQVQPLFGENVAKLIDEAKVRQPKLVAARAKWEAARAGVDSARAEGRPTISLVGSLTRNNPIYQQQAQGLGAATISGSHGSMVGVQITIPLFEGFASSYRVERAEAEADVEEADVRDTELQVALDVWRGYQDLQTDTANLTNSLDLLSDAERALDIARGRYKAGVGAFIELLDAQSALADARRQRVLALSKWCTARLRLAASLGDLGLWSID